VIAVSSDLLWMQPDRVRSGASRMRAAGEALQEVVQQLTTAIQAEGACWGNDEGGQKFAEEYVPASTGTSEALAQLVTTLAQIGDHLQGMADSTEDVDATSIRTDCSGIAPAS